MRHALADDRVKKTFADGGMDLFPPEQITPEAAAALLKSELKLWGDVIRANNIAGAVGLMARPTHRRRPAIDRSRAADSRSSCMRSPGWHVGDVGAGCFVEVEALLDRQRRGDVLQAARLVAPAMAPIAIAIILIGVTAAPHKQSRRIAGAP